MLSASFPRGVFKDMETVVGQPLQRGAVHGLPRFELFQRLQQRAPHAAGAMSPIRVDRDAFKTREQKTNQLSLVGSQHGDCIIFQTSLVRLTINTLRFFLDALDLIRYISAHPMSISEVKRINYV